MIDLRTILANLKPDTATIDIMSNVGVSYSPWTGGAQFTELPGAKWKMLWTYNALEASDGRILKAVKAMFKGGAEVCHVRDFAYMARRTVEPGAPVVAGRVESVSVTAGGAGYTSPPAVAFTGGAGTGAAATAGMGVGSVTVTADGAGYTTAPAVGFTGGAGTGATATAACGVDAVAVGSGGSGYTTAPAVVISGGGGSGATATATVSAGAVTGVTVTARGAGYTSAPTVSFSGGGGVGAAATATLGVDAVTVTNPGSGYTTPPAVAFTGGGGAGATATSALKVLTVTVTTNGANYTSAPAVSFTGGGGAGAAATASIAQTGAVLVIDGCTPSAPAYAMGDQVSYLSVDGMYRMHMATANVNADASGRVLLPILPPIRNAPTTAAGVDSLTPSVSVNLTEGGAVTIDGVVHSASFTLTEALYGIL